MGGMKDLLGDAPYEPDLFGTEPHKLHRADDPITSEIAAHSIDTTKLESLVYRTIFGFGQSGCISDQVRQAHPEKSYSSVTARFASLEEKGYISCGPDTRPGRSGRPQRIMRALKGPME